jgi:hypothetical protein
MDHRDFQAAKELYMPLMERETTWKVMAIGATIVSGLAARKALEVGWRTVKKEDPPKNPAASDVAWPDALTWAVTAGIVVGVARLLARRSVGAGWERRQSRRVPRDL